MSTARRHKPPTCPTSMTVEVAREAATEWVRDHAASRSGFRGAYFIGSTVDLPGNAPLASDSDIDVAVVTAIPEPILKPGKILYDGFILEISLFPWQSIVTIDDLLESYHLAAGFRVDTIIADPTGRLAAIQQEVARGFAHDIWVRRRSNNALEKVGKLLAAIDTSEPWCDQVITWLFAAGVTTHVLLVAGLRNPTVRQRYRAVRELLADYGRMHDYPDLLDLIGCTELDAQRVSRHLDRLETLFDVAASVGRTPFPFSSDITPLARPLAISGSRNLIQAGFHREAVFWIVATFARCIKILATDATERIGDEFGPAFASLLRDLGIGGEADLLARADQIQEFLPQLWCLADYVIDTNPDVIREAKPIAGQIAEND